MKKGQKSIMSIDKPVFVEYDSATEKQKLKKMYEHLTEKSLYPAQNEAVLLDILEYKAGLLVQKFNEAALLNLPQFSRDDILNYIGEFTDTHRLKGDFGEDILKIELFEAFSYDLTISKGLQILTKDEKYIFETKTDLIIPQGETIGYVQIQSLDKTEEVNIYGQGDITILLKPLSYIKSVSNINGVSGGAGEEIDEHYIKRILLAPESFSCAGSRASYIYHTLSAHSAIIDAQAEAPQIPATIQIGENIYTENNGKITGSNFMANINYKTGKCTLTIGENTYIITIPPQTTVEIYPLTEEDTTPNSVLTAVNNKFNGEGINPMCDKVIAVAPIKKSKTINLNVVLSENSDFEKTSNLINSSLEQYRINMRKSLKTEIIPSQITTLVGKIDGVYSVDCGDLTKDTAASDEFFDITFNINITQKGSL